MNLVTNGDFESGDISEWQARYALVDTKTYPLSGKTRRWFYYGEASDQPHPVIVDSSTVLPTQNVPVAPFEGTKMLRINDLEGGQHVTAIHQIIRLPPDFNGQCAFLSFSWGAMLGGSGHTALDRPKFSFEVHRMKGARWKKVVHQDFVAPESSGDGWTDLRKPGATVAVWFKSGDEKRALAGLLPGDLVRIRFTAEDCVDGGHGGAAFIDNVIVTNGCDATGPATLPITFDPLPNVMSPNGDGIDDVWGIHNLQGACLLEFFVYDRWGDAVFYLKQNSYDGSWPSLHILWGGKIRTKRKTKGFGKRKTYYTRMISGVDMDSNVVFYTLKLSNCHESRDETGFTHIFP